MTRLNDSFLGDKLRQHFSDLEYIMEEIQRAGRVPQPMIDFLIENEPEIKQFQNHLQEELHMGREVLVLFATSLLMRYPSKLKVEGIQKQGVSYDLIKPTAKDLSDFTTATKYVYNIKEPSDIMQLLIRIKSFNSLQEKIMDHFFGDGERNFHDIYAMRMITQNDPRLCYDLFYWMCKTEERGHWTIRKDQNGAAKIDDFIANPKPNGYQSLHCTVEFGGINIETQIRTSSMDLQATEGEAAHKYYKEQKALAYTHQRASQMKLAEAILKAYLGV